MRQLLANHLLFLTCFCTPVASASTGGCLEAFRSPIADNQAALIQYAVELGIPPERARDAGSLEGADKDELLALAQAMHEILRAPKVFFTRRTEGLSDPQYSYPSSAGFLGGLGRWFIRREKTMQERLWDSRGKLLKKAVDETDVTLTDATIDLLLQRLTFYPRIDDEVDISREALRQRTVVYVVKHLSAAEKKSHREFVFQRTNPRTGESCLVPLDNRVSTACYVEAYMSLWDDALTLPFMRVASRAGLGTKAWMKILHLRPIFSHPQINAIAMRYLKYLLVDFRKDEPPVTRDIKGDFIVHIRTLAQELAQRFPLTSDNPLDRPIPQSQADARINPAQLQQNISSPRPIRQRRKETSADPSGVAPLIVRGISEEEARALPDAEKMQIVERSCVTDSVFADFQAWAADTEDSTLETVTHLIVRLHHGTPLRELRNIEPTTGKSIYEIKIRYSNDRVFIGIGSAGFRVLVIGDGIKQSRSLQTKAVSRAEDLWRAFSSRAF